ncbi:MAG: type II toxin-antitoxin system Phd/YefM family antitoxin [Kineosporiaceae bacterium]
MDIAISALRASLADYVHRARDGEEIVVTDRGVPVARLLGIETAPAIERMYHDGILVRPSSASRPRATGARRARATGGSVADLVSVQRD